MRRGLALALALILTVSSLMIVQSAFAQSIPKPSVPDFTLKYVIDEYDVATTYKTDPYNGSKIVDQQGYHVNNSSIVVTIENQHFDEHYNGLNYHLFYNVRYKGHFSQDWIAKYSYGNFTLENINPKYWYQHLVLEQEKNTVNTTAYYLATDYSTNAQLDFQVKAVLNYEGQIRVYSDVYDHTGFMIDGYIFDQESGWSNTQIITIPVSSTSVSPSPNPTPTPTVPEFLSWTIPLILSIMLVSAGLLVYHKKHKHNLVKKV